MDGSVLSFFALICLGTGIIFGLAPALHVSKTDVNEVLKEGGRTGSAGVRARRWTGALMVAELALTVVLLAGAGFMIRNFLNDVQPRPRHRYVEAADDEPGAAGAEVSRRSSSGWRSTNASRNG